MFRELVISEAMSNKRVSKEECIEILKSELRGVLAVQGDGGYPYALPIDHFYNEKDGKIYFHSGLTGHKVDAIKRDNKACFCVYNKGFKQEGDWALNISSVIIFGKIEIIEDYDAAMDICRQICYKFTDDEEYIEREIAESGPATLVFALNIEDINGKLVNES